MGRIAFKRSVQNADVQPSWNWIRIADDKIFCRGSVAKAAAVQGNFENVYSKCFCPACREGLQVIRQPEALRDLAFRIVVSIKQENRDAGLPEGTNLAAEEDAGFVVAPVAVIEVTRDYDKIDVLPERRIDQLGESRTR